MLGADHAKPVLRVLSWRDTKKVSSVQQTDTDLGDLLVVAFPGFNIQADEDDVGVTGERCRFGVVNGLGM